MLACVITSACTKEHTNGRGARALWPFARNPNPCQDAHNKLGVVCMCAVISVSACRSVRPHGSWLQAQVHQCGSVGLPAHEHALYSFTRAGQRAASSAASPGLVRLACTQMRAHTLAPCLAPDCAPHLQHFLLLLFL